MKNFFFFFEKYLPELLLPGTLINQNPLDLRLEFKSIFIFVQFVGSLFESVCGIYFQVFCGEFYFLSVSNLS